MVDAVRPGDQPTDDHDLEHIEDFESFEELDRLGAVIQLSSTVDRELIRQIGPRRRDGEGSR